MAKRKKVISGIKKSFVAMIAAFITLSVVSVPAVKAESEDVSYNLQTNVSDDQKSVEVVFESFPNSNNVEILAIGNPDGSISEGSSTSYISTENEILTFVINYKVYEEEEGKIKEIKRTKEVEYEVNQIVSENANEQPVEAFSEIMPLSNSSWSFRNDFNISSTTGGLKYIDDYTLELGNKYAEYYSFTYKKNAKCLSLCGTAFWEGWYAKFAAVSKQPVDFSKGFTVKNMLSSNTTLMGDGFTIGFQTNPNLTYTYLPGGSIGIYRFDKYYGARNGVIFEVDYHDNDNEFGDSGLGKNHIAIHKTNQYGDVTTPVAYTKNITHTNKMTAFDVEWVVTDEATGTGTLTFNYGSYYLKYENFRPHEVFGGTVKNPTPAYLTYSGVLLKNYGSDNKPFQIQLANFNYNNDEVSANNGFITESQARALSNTNGLIPYNNATAVSKSGASATPTATTASWNDIKAGTIGTYDVTYSYGDASTTVKINVVKDGSIISPNKDFALFGVNASLSQMEAQALPSVNSLLTVHEATVTMADGSSATANVSNASWSAIKAGTVGKYTTVISYGTGANYTEKQLTLSVLEDQKHVVNANNGFITQTQAKSIKTMFDFIPYNNASVTTNQGITAAPDSVSTNSWNDITAGTLGTYDITYAYGSGNVRGEKTVKLNVVKDGTVFPPDNSFALYARNGFIKQSEAKLLSDSTQLIPYNDASVTLSDGTSATPLVSVNNWTNITSGTIGSYDVTYLYGSGANQKFKTVKLNIVEDGSVVPPDHSFALYAEDGSISQTQGMALTTQAQLIPYNNAKVTLADGTRAEPTVNASTFSEIVAGTVKVHPVTYGYGSGSNQVQLPVNLTMTADKKHVINAEDAFIYETQAKALTHQDQLIPYNTASVTTNTGGTAAPVVTTGSWANIVAGVHGSYDITYSYGTGITQGSKTVILTVVPDGTVFPPSKDFALYAENGLINVEQAKALTSQTDMIPYNSASVILKNGTHVQPNVTTTSWVAINAGIEGTYPVTYSYGSGSDYVSKTVDLTVTKGITPPSHDFALYARNGFIYKTLAQSLGVQTDMIPYNDAYVTLKEGSYLDPQVATSFWSQIKAGTLGSYDVTYAYTQASESLSTTVKLNVIEDDSIISPNQDFAIFAKSGIIQQSDAQALLNRNELIPYNKATVTLSDGTSDTPVVTTTSWLAIRAGILGTYPVTYSYGSGSNETSKTVNLRVVPDGDVSPEKDFILYASDGFISQDEAKAITAQKDLIPYNNASVILSDGSDAVPGVSTTSYNDIKMGKLGTYKVTYRYGSGSNQVSKTVNLTVHNGTVSPEKNFVLSAYDGLISQSEAKTLSATSQLIPFNKASVVKKDGTTDVPTVTMLPFDWLATTSGIKGSYPVLYSYGSGSDQVQKTVMLTVYEDGGVVSPEKDFVLNARNAVITESEAKSLTGISELIDYNNARVTYANGTTVIPNVSSTDYPSINAGIIGTYNVTYDYGTGDNFTMKVVKVTVVRDGAIISPERDFAIYANSITLTQEDAKALANKEALIPLAQATVYFADGTTTLPTVAVDKWSDLNAGTAGNYEVDFAYNGLVKEVNAEVTQQYYVRHLFDYDRNGRIDILDHVEFTSYMSGSRTITKEILYLSDSNGDGRIDILDLVEINRFISDPTLPLIEVHIPI